MALIWADFPSGSQGLYGTDTPKMLNGVWAEVDGTLVEDPDPSVSGAVLRMRDGLDSVFPLRGDISRFVYPTPVSSAGAGFRLWLTALPTVSTEVPFFAFTNISNQEQITIFVEPNGSISVYRGAIGLTNPVPNRGVTFLGSTAGAVLVANAWQHVELKVLLSETVGTVEVRVNGVAVLVLTNQDTIQDAGSTVAQFFFAALDRGGAGNSEYFVKDVVFWDTTGSQNNDFLGSVAVYALRPESDNSFNWTASSGSTGFNLINEAPPVDAGFISASDALPAASTFNLENLPPDIVSVKGLIPVARARKIDGGDGNLQMGLVGTLTDLGADKPITTAFTYHWDVSELSPDTGAPWTPVEVDAVKLQVNRTL